jgi:hypothetical protein
MRDETILIEKTAKRWKGLQVLGVAGMVIGPLFMIIAAMGASIPVVYFGSSLAACGLLAYAYAKCMAWWHHA